MQDLRIADNNLLINFLTDPRKRVFRHLLLITLLLVMSVSRMLIVSPEGVSHPIMFIWGCLGFAFLNGYSAYFTIYILTPRFLLRKKYWAFSLCLLTLITSFVGGEFLIEYIFIYGYHFTPGEFSYLNAENNIILLTVLSSVVGYGIGILGTSFTVVLQHWMTSGRRVLELENVSLQAELEQLKNQVNPDFLFKMLDEAAKLTTSDPEQVSQLFSRLSKVLRYQLYDSTREKVILHTDILFLEHMLTLQTMRSKGFSFTLSEEGDTVRTLVPPLLFTSIVEYIIRQIPENAEGTHLRIHFQVEDGQLLFTCVGSGLKHLTDENMEDPTLESAKRRFELLFPDSYIWKLTVQESVCTINLTIYV